MSRIDVMDLGDVASELRFFAESTESILTLRRIATTALQRIELGRGEELRDLLEDLEAEADAEPALGPTWPEDAGAGHGAGGRW